MTEEIRNKVVKAFEIGKGAVMVTGKSVAPLGELFNCVKTHASLCEFVEVGEDGRSLKACFAIEDLRLNSDWIGADTFAEEIEEIINQMEVFGIETRVDVIAAMQRDDNCFIRENRKLLDQLYHNYKSGKSVEFLISHPDRQSNVMGVMPDGDRCSQPDVFDQHISQQVYHYKTFGRCDVYAVFKFD